MSSTQIEIDLYHKNDAGEWLIINYAEGGRVKLNSIGLQFSVEQVYRNLALTTETES